MRHDDDAYLLEIHPSGNRRVTFVASARLLCVT